MKRSPTRGANERRQTDVKCGEAEPDRHRADRCRYSRSSRDRNYPTFAGPIVLLAVAVIVAFVRRRWTAYVGLLVNLVLGVGAIIAAVMTGEFVAQLTDVGRAGVFVASVMHVVWLVAAVAGGVGMLLRPRGAGEHER